MTFPLSPGVYFDEIDLTASVTGISSSAGAIAGIFGWGPMFEPMLMSSEAQLKQTFGAPTNLNPETWFSAANFLGYTNALWVVRTANTTSNTANAALNAVANTGPVANILDEVILNQHTFSTQFFTDTNVLYVARYPGALGNSLRVAQVDSPNAYSSNVSFGGTIVSGNATGNSYSGSLSVSIGSNTGKIVFTPISGSNVAAGNTFATTLMGSFTVGDQILIGNTTLGTAYTTPLKITGISNAVTNSTATVVNLNFSNPSRLAYNYSANTVKRSWEFSREVGTGPSETPSVLASTSNAALVDQLSVVVIDQNGLFTGVPGTILETYNNVSYAQDALNPDGSPAYYQTVINQNSNYIWAINDRNGLTSANSATLVNSTNQNPLSLTFNLGQDGDNEAVTPLQTLANGWQLFTNKIYPISLLIQGKATSGSGTYNGGSYSNFQLTNWIVQNVIDQRKRDCILFASPDKATVVSNAGFEAISIAGWTYFVNPSTYLFMDTGYKYQYDRYNNIYRWIPLNGDTAGTRAYTNGISAPWFSNAGINNGQINNVTKIAYNPGETDRDYLYPLGINPVITEAGYGTYLDGDRMFTIQSTAFNRINVRGLFIYCEQSIVNATKTILFSINDVFTQNQFKNMVNPFLKGIVGARGITDFIVVCDATNNTPQVVDANQFVAGIYIKPARVIDFIRLDFVAVSDSVSFSEIENPSY
jgi:phage tail sheath protein FI